MKENKEKEPWEGHSPEPWHWNSYSGIFSGDCSDGKDPFPVAWVDHLPGATSTGDEIHGPRANEACANAILIENAPRFKRLLKEAERALDEIQQYACRADWEWDEEMTCECGGCFLEAWDKDKGRHLECDLCGKTKPWVKTEEEYIRCRIAEYKEYKKADREQEEARFSRCT